jgi:HlyD family secretion protein
MLARIARRSYDARNFAMRKPAFILCLAATVIASCAPREKAPDRFVRIGRGPARVWTTYDGQLESRQVRDIMSNLGGSATIVEIVPEGTVVKPGDLLVRLDSSQFDRDLLRLERDYALAAADLSSLTNAKLPLEIRDLESRFMTAQSQLAAEQQTLADTEELVKEGLLSDLETKKQLAKVAAVRSQADNAAQQVILTRDHVLPASVEAARAKVASAEQELKLGRDQVAQCVIRAPAAGYVVYKPVHVGTEFRTVRVGDSVFKNQPFMSLPDLGDLVVNIDVPESELSLVRTGMIAAIEPSAYPNMRLDGIVESVGSMAQSKTDRPAWQKFFRVIIGLKHSDPDLRTGMSVAAQVLSLDEKDTVLIPRLAVRWEQGRAFCEVRRAGKSESQQLRLGTATEQSFVVLDGVKPGDEVALP